MLYGDIETCDVPNLPAGWSAFSGAIGWMHPYTEPPDGLPRHLMETIFRVPPGKGCPTIPPDMEALLRELGLGSGWCWTVACIPHPIKRWSPARTFKYRLQRLELRIRRKYPLFAEAFIEEAKRRKPEYYGVPRATASGDGLPAV